MELVIVGIIIDFLVFLVLLLGFKMVFFRNITIKKIVRHMRLRCCDGCMGSDCIFYKNKEENIDYEK